MMRNIKNSLRTLSFTLLALCFSLNAHAVQASASDAQVKKSQSARGLLWELKSGEKTIYLFGSIHLAKADFFPLMKEVEEAYAKSNSIAVELDVTDTSTNAKMLPLLTYAAPDQLQKHVSVKTWTMLSDTYGAMANNLRSYKPAVAASALTMMTYMQRGYLPEAGVDRYFIEKAKADKKMSLN